MNTSFKTGSFLSSLVITAAGRATWFAQDLNRSRLDDFYWLLACIGAVNLAFYMLVAAKCSVSYTVIGRSRRRIEIGDGRPEVRLQRKA